VTQVRKIEANFVSAKVKSAPDLDQVVVMASRGDIS
jgi:hypothetical protein